MSFLFGQVYRPERRFNTLYKASSCRQPPLSVCVQAGESLCMTIYWRTIPLSQDLPPITAAVGRRGGRERSCWDERVCLCVCSSSGSKAINPVPKCQVACQHASLCHPSLSQTKGPLVLWNGGLRMGNDDLSCMEKGLAMLHRLEGDKGKMNC